MQRSYMVIAGIAVLLVIYVVALVSCMSLSGLVTAIAKGTKNLLATGSLSGKQALSKLTTKGTVIKAVNCTKDNWCQVDIQYSVGSSSYTRTSIFLAQRNKNYTVGENVTVCYQAECPGYEPMIC